MASIDEDKGLVHTISRDAFKLLEDETRRRIVFLLRDNVLTVKEIATRLGLTPQNIYHHMNKLQDSGVVKLSYERRSNHLIESYYSLPADTFIYSEDRIDEKPVQRYMNILFGLKELGIDVDVSMENASKLVEIQELYQSRLDDPENGYELCEKCSYSGFFMKFGPMNPMQLNRIIWYANLIKLTDEEFDESIYEYRKLRDFLRSIVN